jgi:hypothetical protein
MSIGHQADARQNSRARISAVSVAPHRHQPGQPGKATTFRFIDADHLAALIAEA